MPGLFTSAPKIPTPPSPPNPPQNTQINAQLAQLAKRQGQNAALLSNQKAPRAQVRGVHTLTGQ